MTKPSRTFEIPVDRLIELTEKSLRGIGVPEDDIEIVRDVLLYAELRGNNQGLVKIPARGVLPRADAKPVEITRRVACAALINANGNSGMAAVSRAATEAADLARTHGVGIVGVNNLSSSTGAIGFYADRIARENLIGIVMAGSVKAVAVAGGVKPVLGTNPIAIGVPSSVSRSASCRSFSEIAAAWAAMRSSAPWIALMKGNSARISGSRRVS